MSLPLSFIGEPGCMRRPPILALVLLAFGTSACGSTCDDAVDKLDECGLETSQAEAEAEECNEDQECAAECINDASCSDLENLSDSLMSCFVKCGE
jgi:hypothetical protein